MFDVISRIPSAFSKQSFHDYHLLNEDSIISILGILFQCGHLSFGDRSLKEHLQFLFCSFGEISTIILFGDIWKTLTYLPRV